MADLVSSTARSGGLLSRTWLARFLKGLHAGAAAPPAPLRAAFLLCSLCSLCGWWSTAAEFAADPFQDWAVFHSAATAYFRFGDWSAILANWTLPDHPWLYPPSFLLLLLPFGAAAFETGCALFLEVTFVGMIAAIWRFAGE